MPKVRPKLLYNLQSLLVSVIHSNNVWCAQCQILVFAGRSISIICVSIFVAAKVIMVWYVCTAALNEMKGGQI